MQQTAIPQKFKIRFNWIPLFQLTMSLQMLRIENNKTPRQVQHRILIVVTTLLTGNTYTTSALQAFYNGIISLLSDENSQRLVLLIRNLGYLKPSVTWSEALKEKQKKTIIYNVDIFKSPTLDVYNLCIWSTKTRPLMFEHPAQERHTNYKLKNHINKEKSWNLEGIQRGTVQQ